MKRLTIKITAVVMSLLLSGLAYAYDYKLINILKAPVKVRVKLSGINEPWYYSNTISPSGLFTFKFGVNEQVSLNAAGTQKEYTGRKAGFCLSQIQVAAYVNQNGQWQETDTYIDTAPMVLDIESIRILGGAIEYAQNGNKTAAAQQMQQLAAKSKVPTTQEGSFLKRTLQQLATFVDQSTCNNRSFYIYPEVSLAGTIVPNSYFIISAATTY